VKKGVSYSGKHKLSGSDRKKLRKGLERKLPKCTDEQLDEMLPSKGDLSMAKLGAPHKGIVYFNGEMPVLIDVNGKGDFLIPTVFSLWSSPNLLPAFEVKHCQVTRFIVGGADLMLPGVRVPKDGFPLEGEGSFSQGDVYCVMVPGNPMPLAVGTTLMDSTTAAGGKGKLLQLVHSYGDALWAAAEGKPTPNAGFLPDGVVPLGGSMDDPMEDEGADVAFSEGDEAGVPAPSPGPMCAEASAGVDHWEDVPTAPSDATQQDADLSASKLADGVAELAMGEVADGAEADTAGASGGESKMSPKEMDALLEACMLQALRTTVTDKTLPLLQGQLWNAHVLLARPPNTKLDVRLSSYKKLQKFLEVNSKDGLLDVKIDKKSKELQVVGVHRDHARYCAFQLMSATVGSESAAADAAAMEKEKAQKDVLIIDVFKPAHDSMPVFEPMGGSKSNLYTHEELANLVNGYTIKAKLGGAEDESCPHITLDPALSDALYKGLLKKGTEWPTTILKADLVPAFTKRQAAHHLVRRGKDQLVGKGAPTPLEVYTDKRQGSKRITRVVGLEGYLLSPDKVAGDLQRAFNGSASVQDVPGKQKLHEVVIQGDHAPGVAKYLTEECGIPIKLLKKIDTTCGKGKDK